MNIDVISKPAYEALTKLTQETRLNLALTVAIKDLIRLRLKEVQEQRRAYEKQYQMDFDTFKKAWDKGTIPDKYTYEVERDYWLWEAAVTDEASLIQMQEEML